MISLQRSLLTIFALLLKEMKSKRNRVLKLPLSYFLSWLIGSFESIPKWLILMRTERHQCTGMLIQQDTVLSSASCITDNYGWYFNYFNDSLLLNMTIILVISIM